MTTKTPLLLAQLLLVTTVLGCASEPTLPPPSAIEASLMARESVRQIPIVPTSNSIILGPGESITIRTSLSDQVRYLCSNRVLLLCDRLNRNLYCFCPGSRQRR